MSTGALAPGTAIPVPWPPDHLPVLLAVGTAALCLVVHHYGAGARRLAPRLPSGLSDDARELVAVLLQRLLGAVLLGLVPALVAALWLPGSLGEHGLGPGRPAVGVVWVAVLLGVALPATWRASRRPRFREHYPEMRLGRWTRRTRLASALTWGLYLLGYELLFRGVLLFALARDLGAWPAIALGTLAYVLAHLPKNAMETAGTLPMGVLFGAAALSTGAFWPVFAAHLCIALLSEHWALRPGPGAPR